MLFKISLRQNFLVSILLCRVGKSLATTVLTANDANLWKLLNIVS